MIDFWGKQNKPQKRVLRSVIDIQEWVNFLSSLHFSSLHFSMSVSESKRRFLNYNFEKDENWLKYKRSLEIPSDLPNETEILNRLKQKWYKKNIVSIFLTMYLVN